MKGIIYNNKTLSKYNKVAILKKLQIFQEFLKLFKEKLIETQRKIDKTPKLEKTPPFSQKLIFKYSEKEGYKIFQKHNYHN